MVVSTVVPVASMEWMLLVMPLWGLLILAAAALAVAAALAAVATPLLTRVALTGWRDRPVPWWLRIALLVSGVGSAVTAGVLAYGIVGCPAASTCDLIDVGLDIALYPFLGLAISFGTLIVLEPRDHDTVNE